MEEIKAVYNEIILEHNQYPFNKKELSKYTIVEEGVNPSCGDQIKLFVLIENEKIEDISFIGQGCSISTASSSILTSTVKGMKIKEVEELIKSTIEYIKTGKTEGMEKIENTDIVAFENIHKFPVRIKCALLPWITLNEALKNPK